MFATVSKVNSLFPRAKLNNNQIKNNNKIIFQRTQVKTFTQQNNFASGRGVTATSPSLSPSFSTSSSPSLPSPSSSLFLSKLKLEEEEEELLKQNNKINNYLSNSWLMAIGAVLGLTAISLLSADEEEKKTKTSGEATVETPALSPSEWRSLTLSEVHTVNHNTKLFRFKFDNEEQVAGLTVASCLVVRVYNEETKEFDVRPYTPVSSPETKGYLDLIIKKYDTGKVTPKIFALNVGDKLEFQGPWTKIEYKPNMKKEIGMIAGGTGITPMLQVLKEILKNKEDKTKVSLIFANITESDILLRSELDLLASKYSNFKVYYTLDRPSENWKQGKGFVSEQMIKENFSAPSNDQMIFVCGPDPMVNFLAGPKGPNYTQGDLSGLLAKLGYTKDQVFKF